MMGKMIGKGLLGITVALISLTLLVATVMVQTVMAQSDDESTTPAVAVEPNMAAASVVQTVPVTLTLTIPGPTGPVTVEVPIFIALDIRIGISPDMTTTFAVTPSVVAATATPTPTDVVGTSDEDDTTEATVAAPTATATLLPTPVPATPTPEPVTDEAEAVVEATAVPLPTATVTAETVAEPVAEAPICPDQRSVLIAPGVGQTISGSVNILGTATHENFQYYKVEYAIGGDVDPNATYAYLADGRAQVTGGLLAAFDSTSFDNGVYTIKLTVVDNSGNFPPPCTVTVNIAN